MRYFLKLSYNGKPFHGWQSQPNALGVQQTIEEALSIVARLPVTIVGAGRTDSGVHARRMYAHFDLKEPVQDKKRFLLSLNRLVGKDISIEDLIEVDDSAHARFDASERTYKYFVTYSKSPFIHPFSWRSPSRLDIQPMNEAAMFLTEISDFTSFAKLHSDSKTNICDVRRAEWEEIYVDIYGNIPDGDHNDGIVFTISADRFLRNMVRSIVGTLVDVGRRKISVDDFKEIVSRKDRCAAGTSMPGEALFLWDIKYPFIT